jgi:hypothetical protein
MVIPCAGAKNGQPCLTLPGMTQKVMFCAQPSEVPPGAFPSSLFARPDDMFEGRSWRSRVAELPPGCHLSAGSLYRPPIYRRMLQHCGAAGFYILSAGWGLVHSKRPLPPYNITFSPTAPAYARRNRSDSRWHDFQDLDIDSPELIVFIGGQDYLPSFLYLTARRRPRRASSSTMRRICPAFSRRPPRDSGVMRRLCARIGIIWR